jgi:hypothetical protein
MQETRKEELKDQLLEIVHRSSSTADRCCLQQVLEQLERYETGAEDSLTGVTKQVILFLEPATERCN